jgi:hypothetical protein
MRVCPTNTVYQSADLGLCYAKLSGKHSLSCTFVVVPPPYFPHVGFSKLGAARRFTVISGALAALFANHVPSIYLRGAQEQVVRSNTRRVVALMQHVQSVGNWADAQLPCNPVRPNDFACHFQSAVTPSVTEAGPLPALGSVSHSGPKLQLECHTRLVYRELRIGRIKAADRISRIVQGRTEDAQPNQTPTPPVPGASDAGRGLSSAAGVSGGQV